MVSSTGNILEYQSQACHKIAEGLACLTTFLGGIKIDTIPRRTSTSPEYVTTVAGTHC